MTNEHDEHRLSRLEQKVDTLNRLTTVQIVIVVGLTAVYFFSLLHWLIIVVALVLAVLVLFRRALPRWAHRCSQFFGSPSSEKKSSSAKTS